MVSPSETFFVRWLAARCPVRRGHRARELRAELPGHAMLGGHPLRGRDSVVLESALERQPVAALLRPPILIAVT